ncbi:hypothetical protein BO70DRAFT_379670 [Aspergillus heteromorphus CBS 117.55]|uniref:Hydrophobin n=1 Tax=Aspergillus heteromorphus CBS 117.55 TaxID=1448321 RepID=A0A317WDC0_9EURO|nr:uncharacterized protein BO70DRAFT_379670 [Aspergillus heteromorphus CBS 117.55]PWY82170.1 hypothetical protein BO70DRAFT_379670 [Aspergillus heteromorphus CBS 117.55]
MQFTIAKVLSLALALAASASAGSVANSKALKDISAGKCDVGNISCCNPSSSVKTDGVLNNLLGGGLVKSLVGDSGSACAETSLIDELGILSLVKDSDNGPVCQNIIACCPGEGNTCVAIGDGSESDDKE